MGNRWRKNKGYALDSMVWETLSEKVTFKLRPTRWEEHVIINGAKELYAKKVTCAKALRYERLNTQIDNG